MFSRSHCINLFIALNISFFFFPYFEAFISFACRDRFFVQYKTAWIKEKRQVNGERFNGIPNIFDLGRLSLNQPHISRAVLDVRLGAVTLQRKTERQVNTDTDKSPYFMRNMEEIRIWREIFTSNMVFSRKIIVLLYKTKYK